MYFSHLCVKEEIEKGKRIFQEDVFIFEKGMGQEYSTVLRVEEIPKAFVFHTRVCFSIYFRVMSICIFHTGV